MSNVNSDEILPSQDFSVDSEALRLLEADLAANQSVRSVKTPFKLFVEDLSNKMFKNRITTVAAFAFMLGCCTVIYWNLFMRMPDPDERIILESENRDMSAYLDVLVKKISETDHRDLDEKLEVENSRVFNGFPKLAIWINSLVKHGELLDLEIAYHIEDAGPAPVEGVLNVPIVLKISPVSSRSNTVFENTMKLVNRMLADPWHLDIVSAAARGGEKGLAKVEVTIQVWLADSDEYEQKRKKNEATLIADIDSDEEFIQ